MYSILWLIKFTAIQYLLPSLSQCVLLPSLFYWYIFRPVSCRCRFGFLFLYCIRSLLSIGIWMYKQVFHTNFVRSDTIVCCCCCLLTVDSKFIVVEPSNIYVFSHCLKINRIICTLNPCQALDAEPKITCWTIWFVYALNALILVHPIPSRAILYNQFLFNKRF